MMWESKFAVSSFSNTTPKDIKILLFAWDIWGDQMPMSIKVEANCLEPFQVIESSLQELQGALATALPDPLLPTKNPRLKKFLSKQVYISPFYIIVTLLASCFLTPVGPWIIVASKAMATGLTPTSRISINGYMGTW